ncbi:MAG: DUF2059 domain-containing protein [Actinobacteria bacterium]|nr:DUF2059 domain-containing protein [Actinomycetota bacterium]
MAIVRYILTVWLFIIISACSNAGPGQVSKSLPDNRENRLMVAKQFLEIMPPKEMLHGVATRVGPKLPEKERKVFLEVINSKKIEQAANGIALDGLIKTFTVGELNAMVAFYGSPDGQSAFKKFSSYTSAVMPQIQHQVRTAVLAAEKQQEPQEQQKPKAQAQAIGKKEQKNTHSIK